jgi:hypothetical protein
MESKEMMFIRLAKEIEAEQKLINAKRDLLTTVMQEIGVGQYVQDASTSTVYKMVKPTGTFMYFRDIDYTRTALEGERAGTLSKKEAEEAGFAVLKK